MGSSFLGCLNHWRHRYLLPVLEKASLYGGSKAQYNESTDQLITSGARLILPSSALNKLQSSVLSSCGQIHEIQVVCTLESGEHFEVWDCRKLWSLHGLPNAKNLKSFSINSCNCPRVVKGLNKLEFVERVLPCGSLERLTEVSRTKLPNDSRIYMSGCRKDFRGSRSSYKHHKEQESDFKEEQES